MKSTLRDSCYQGRPCKHGHVGVRFKSTRHCVECSAEKGARYYATKGKQKAAGRHRAAKYGLDGPRFSALLARARACCEICVTPLDLGDNGANALAVDHCHLTGRVRGLLCNNCNRALGLFGDDPQRLRAAADYLNEMKT